jgi:RNA polymerase sigma factor (sigma-70 family)
VAKRAIRADIESNRVDDTEAAEELGWAIAAREERSAFGPLYDRYASRIYRYCYRRLGDHEAAEDATSQTFEKALAGLARFETGSFRAWLFTIADRVVTDVFRRRRPRVDLAAALGVPDGAAGPEAAAIGAERQLAVQQMLARLSDGQRRLVALRLAGLTGPEIAAVLGVRPEAVRGLQFRAYRRLRELLGDREDW